jgi:Uma2 family endonuclease
MVTPTRKQSFTYEDYLLFPNDGRRHELIGGEHHASPCGRRFGPPVKKHQRASANLQRNLSSFIFENRLGFLYSAPFDVILSGADVVQPDLIFVSNERSEIEQDHGIVGAPDLVVEILSESNRKMDEITKRKLYEWAGVLEYWIVDPLLETVKVYRLDGTVYERVAELSVEAGDRLETPLLPGLTIELAQIFA